MRVTKYKREFKDEWNNFLVNSKNATFLFNRNFVDYHAERFEDYSLLIFDENNKIVALLPANLSSQNEIVSHQGLTYGGFIFRNDIKLISAISIIYHTLKFLHENGIQDFYLKCLPCFYKISPSDEIDYTLFLLNARLYRRDVAFVIDLKKRIPYSGNVRREGSRAEKLSVCIKEEDSFDEFWNEVLSPNLIDRFNVKPVHSLEEIKLLKSHFPENIKQYNVYIDNEVVSGTTLFLNNKVVHCQYISSTEHGRKSGCLNFLFKRLIDDTFSGYDYFDFGIVNENEGRAINSGMLFWKESFGGRAKKHDFYMIRTDSYTALESIIIKK